MEKCCVCQLGKPAKRAREEEGEDMETRDRLSHLPDFILYHILSFLDTRHAVQTCVLSRVWRSVWKHVPVLDLRRSSFRDGPGFVRFVNKVLALHYQLDVNKISFSDLELKLWKPRYKEMFGRVMEYASSHGCQHLVINLPDDVPLYDLFVPSSNLSFNLKTLELECARFLNGFGSSCFAMLTTLNLKDCRFWNDREGVYDLISNFPCLQNFVTIGSHWAQFNYGKVLSTKLSGPHLLSLKLDRLFNAEIIAPRLKFFSFQLFVGYGPRGLEYQGFSKLSIPSLDHIDVLVTEQHALCIANDEEKIVNSLDGMFQGFHNVISFVIRSSNNQVLEHICKYVKQNRSLFTRLKSFESVKLDE